jgi:hypothetical protein
MTAANPGRRSHGELARQLQPTQDCVPIERFGDELTEHERDHMDLCTRCQAEFALWQGFVDPEPLPGEQADVQWVLGELQRRCVRRLPRGLHRPSPHLLTRFGARPLVAVAASMLVAIVAGYLLWSPEPAINVTDASELVYRTASVDVLAPVGDLRVAPKELAWAPVRGAVKYDVRVFEVDGNTLWSESTSATRADLPAALVAQFVPGKAILWEVTARGSAGVNIAASGQQRFRVLVPSVPRRQ